MATYISTLSHQSCDLRDWRPVITARVEMGFKLIGAISDPASITGFSNEFEGPELSTEEKDKLYFE